MRSYFINLFDYDCYANNLIAKAIIEAGEPEMPVKLMAHLLAAQQVWYNRCNNLPAFGGALWPDWKAGTFEKMIAENHDKWVAFLNNVNEADFGQQIAYQNLKGEPFTNQLSDLLAHVINHGTHHRAQAGQHLKLAGMEHLPATDYILYLRLLK